MMRRLLILLVLPALLCSGCGRIIEVDETAYVFTMSLDKSEQNRLRVGARIPVPRLIGKVQGQAVGTGVGTTSQLYLNSVTDAATVIDGITTLQMVVGRRISLEHTSLIVFSAALAQEGLARHLRSLVREPEVRSTALLYVTPGDPFRVIEVDRPFLEVNPAKFIDLISRQQYSSGMTATMRLGDFYALLESEGTAAVLPLVALNERVLNAIEGKEREAAGGPAAPDPAQEEDIEAKRQPEEAAAEVHPARTPGSYMPGNLPRAGGNPLEFTGLAVFRRDRMVGTLNGNEALVYNMLTGHFSQARLVIPESGKTSAFVTIGVYRGRLPELKVELAGDQPVLQASLVVDAELEAVQPGVIYEQEIYSAAARELERYLYRLITATVAKTQRWGADIFGFGRHLRSWFLTWTEWSNYDWPAAYQQARLELDVQVHIRRPGLLSST
jgi:spore germination protein KC